MKKYRTAIIIAAAVIITVGIYMFMQKQKTERPKAGTLQIQDGRITPESITIKTNSSLTVVNKDEESYGIISEHPGFEFEELQPGQKYSYIFNRKGKWKVGLKDSPFGMEAVINVE